MSRRGKYAEFESFMNALGIKHQRVYRWTWRGRVFVGWLTDSGGR